MGGVRKSISSTNPGRGVMNTHGVQVRARGHGDAGGELLAILLPDDRDPPQLLELSVRIILNRQPSESSH